jgi:hypothetical protein
MQHRGSAGRQTQQATPDQVEDSLDSVAAGQGVLVFSGGLLNWLRMTGWSSCHESWKYRAAISA